MVRLCMGTFQLAVAACCGLRLVAGHTGSNKATPSAARASSAKNDKDKAAHNGTHTGDCFNEYFHKENRICRAEDTSSTTKTCKSIFAMSAGSGQVIQVKFHSAEPTDAYKFYADDLRLETHLKQFKTTFGDFVDSNDDVLSLCLQGRAKAEAGESQSDIAEKDLQAKLEDLYAAATSDTTMPLAIGTATYPGCRVREELLETLGSVLEEELMLRLLRNEVKERYQTMQRIAPVAPGHASSASRASSATAGGGATAAPGQVRSAGSARSGQTGRGPTAAYSGTAHRATPGVTPGVAPGVTLQLKVKVDGKGAVTSTEEVMEIVVPEKGAAIFTKEQVTVLLEWLKETDFELTRQGYEIPSQQDGGFVFPAKDEWAGVTYPKERAEEYRRFVMPLVDEYLEVHKAKVKLMVAGSHGAELVPYLETLWDNADDRALADGNLP